MPIIPSLINWLSSKRLSQIDHFRYHPEEVQEGVFSNLISQAESTEWGRKFNFGSIRSVEDLRARIPLQTYDDIVPYIERLKKGEKNLLWPGETRWFAKSSGTTSTKSKFIPISSQALEECHYQAAKDVVAIYLNNYPSSRIFSGKTLTLGGSHRIDQVGSRSLSGDLSAILIENSPPWAELIRTPKQDIALIEDFEEKLDLIARHTINENVTSFAGVPSWYLTLIKHILSFTGKNNLLDVWPNLEAFFHGGISFTPYREIYQDLIRSNQMHYMETYNASEGFFGIQDEPSKDDMLLMLDYGIFFEFVRTDEINNNNAVFLTAAEVSAGVNYAMVISTNGGLWRYLIGDTVIFTSTKPLRFRITGRTKHFINAFGEELIIDNAEKALQEACKVTRAIISEYTAGPIFMDATSRGSHEWLIEFEKEPDSLENFTTILDETLKSVNSDYEAKRFKDINLYKPVVRSVPVSTFHKWMKMNNKLGGQNKVPRLSNNRDFIEQLSRIAGLK